MGYMYIAIAWINRGLAGQKIQFSSSSPSFEKLSVSSRISVLIQQQTTEL
ncbi:protein of unknown function [Xenorhabdus doucetiae]|uniref:Uncharacterized protein n=1 Tax=Xenorhabdus doucetiae TaxID=351671 RepID=A0A068QNU6_9GAMM|nr:protein of unknown function [Xenorhabdus doucetiae]